MRDLLLLILLALATYRIWRLLALDLVTADLRVRLFGSRDGSMSIRHPMLLEMWECPWCLGFYLSIVVVMSTNLLIDFPLPALYVLATSTIVGFLGARLED